MQLHSTEKSLLMQADRTAVTEAEVEALFSVSMRVQILSLPSDIRESS